MKKVLFIWTEDNRDNEVKIRIDSIISLQSHRGGTLIETVTGRVLKSDLRIEEIEDLINNNSEVA